MAAPRANCRPAWPRCRVGPQPDDPPGPRNLCKRDGDAKPDHIQSSAGGNLTTSSAVNSQMQQVLKRNSACARLVLARSALPFRADSTSSPNDCTGWQFRHAAAFQCRRITVLSQQTMIASSWAALPCAGEACFLAQLVVERASSGGGRSTRLPSCRHIGRSNAPLSSQKRV
jgi:hypothetical protein